MKNRIGGLFDTQESANQAYEALQNSGFADDKINMLVHKPRNKTARSTEVSVQEIAKYALLGGVIGGLIGGFLGFLVGAGVIPLPYLEPGSAPRDGLFVFMSVAWGLVTGGLTGAILGVASRLLRSREKAEVMISNEIMHSFMGAKQSGRKYYWYFFIKEDADFERLEDTIWLSKRQFQLLQENLSTVSSV